MRTILNNRSLIEPEQIVEGPTIIDYVDDNVTIKFDHRKLEDQRTLVIIPTEKEAFMLAAFFQAVGTDIAITRRKAADNVEPEVDTKQKKQMSMRFVKRLFK